MTELILVGCVKNDNQFFTKWYNSVNYGAPPFELIENKHLIEGIRQLKLKQL